MTISAREKKLALLVPAALLVFVVLRYTVFSDPVVSTSSDTGSTEMAEQRAVRLRKVAATLQAREIVFKQTGDALAQREKGIIQADTAPQAQAAVLEIARRVGKAEQLDIRAGEFGAPKAFGDYGMVYAGISFECHVDQLVNFYASLAHQPELVVPSDERITSGNPKDKTMMVRMTLAGVVSKRLVPEKKGLNAF